jgi:UDP-2,4-diacetamido-2,4,6-trideoxy-beta-L-altropyranose hydrolase
MHPKIKYKIRQATTADIENVFKLSNDPFVRKHSIITNKIKWEEHVAWFHKIINHSNHLFYVVYDVNDIFIGQIRFHVQHDSAVISLSIVESFRGKKLALPLLADVIQLIFTTRPDIKQLVAYIKPDNQASLHLFIKTGFREMGSKQVHHTLVKRLILEK